MSSKKAADLLDIVHEIARLGDLNNFNENEYWEEEEERRETAAEIARLSGEEKREIINDRYEFNTW